MTFSDEDVDLVVTSVARRLLAATGLREIGAIKNHALKLDAIAALEALAAAGRLLPEGAETRTEWAWHCGGARGTGRPCLHEGDEKWVRQVAPDYWPGGHGATRVVGVGPWVPVPSLPAEETPDQP